MKQDKERLRKERQRQRKLDVASMALQWAMEAIAEYGARCVRFSHGVHQLSVHSTHTRRTDDACVCVCVWWSSESTARSMNEALAQAEKHASRSEPLAALMAEAKAAHEQARAAAAE